MTQHLRAFADPVSSDPEKMGTRFRRAVTARLLKRAMFVVRFGKHDRKIDVMRRHIVAQPRPGTGVGWRSVSRKSSRTCGHRTGVRATTVSRGSRSPRLIVG
ncbi:MAG: hypothetical protein R2722_07110 [Tessaracoccus sp.]